MTNHIAPGHGAPIDPSILALAPVGGKRRPVKVVEHPAFRTSRGRAASDAPFTGRQAVKGLVRVGGTL